MVGKACLPMNAYFLWTPDITHLLGSMSVCLTFPLLPFVYIDYDFSKYDFGRLTSNSLKQ